MTSSTITFSDEHELYIQKIISQGKYKDRSDFFEKATNFYLWVIGEYEAGNIIASWDRKNNRYHYVTSENLQHFDPYNDNEPAAPSGYDGSA
jgi:hypothetical protein